MSQEEVSEKLLYNLWVGMNADYKRKYAKNIWDQFEEGIRSSAYTSNLKVFLSNMRARFDIRIDQNSMKDVLHVVNGGEDEQILDDLRDETTYMVLLVRTKNQLNKQNNENVHHGGSRDGSLFDQP